MAPCADSLREEIETALVALERERGQRLGDDGAPLLLSVRSGAPISMPGMMDTVLNRGATGAASSGRAAQVGQKFALDSRRRFLESFATVVLGVEQAEFDALRTASRGTGHEDQENLSALIRAYEKGLADDGTPIPEDPRKQLLTGVEAVFRSWRSPRAKNYRELLDHLQGQPA